MVWRPFAPTLERADTSEVADLNPLAPPLHSARLFPDRRRTEGFEQKRTKETKNSTRARRAKADQQDVGSLSIYTGLLDTFSPNAQQSPFCEYFCHAPLLSSSAIGAPFAEPRSV